MSSSALGNRRRSRPIPNRAPKRTRASAANTSSPQSTSAAARRRRNRRRRNRQVNRLPVMSHPGPHIDKCTFDWVNTLLDPTAGEPGCYPNSTALPASIFRAWKKIGMTISGSTTAGFALFAPSNGVANNSACLWTTTASYITDPAVYATTGTGVAASFSNSPYSSSDISAAAGFSQYRLVAALLRICYTGTVLNCSGYYVPYETADHTSLVGVGATTPINYPGGATVPIEPGKWCTVRYSGPKNPSEADYQATLGVGSECIGIGISGAANSASFIVESYAIYELIGAKNLMPRPIAQDPVGLAYVNSKFNEMGNQFLQRMSDQTIWKNILSGIGLVGKAALLASTAASSPAVGAFVKGLASPAGMRVAARALM